MIIVSVNYSLTFKLGTAVTYASNNQSTKVMRKSYPK